MTPQLRTAFLTFGLALALTLAACGGSDSGGTNVGASETGTITETDSSEDSFSRNNWSELQSDPGGHKGAAVDVVGKVFGTTETNTDKGLLAFQMWVDPANSEFNTIVATKDMTLRVSDGDFVRVVGEVAGEFKGENAFGAEVTAVTVKASTVTKVSALDAAEPATRTLPRQQSARSGVIVTVQKIEISPSETRVFLAAKNRSKDDFSLFSSSLKLVADGTQVAQAYAFEYPELASELSPGARTEGVAVFKPVPENTAKFQLQAEGYSDNFEIGTLKWEFTWG